MATIKHCDRCDERVETGGQFLNVQISEEKAGIAGHGTVKLSLNVTASHGSLANPETLDVCQKCRRELLELFHELVLEQLRDVEAGDVARTA